MMHILLAFRMRFSNCWFSETALRKIHADSVIPQKLAEYLPALRLFNAGGTQASGPCHVRGSNAGPLIGLSVPIPIDTDKATNQYPLPGPGRKDHPELRV